MRGNGLTYDVCLTSDENSVKNNVHYSDLKTYHQPTKMLLKNSIFREYYNLWYEYTFGKGEPPTIDWEKQEAMEDVPDVPGLPAVVSGPAPELKSGCPTGSDSDDSDDDWRLRQAEMDLQEEFELEYQEYKRFLDCWNLNNVNQLIEIPEELFRTNYINEIRDFDKKYRKHCAYFAPYPNGQLPDLGPLDRGVPLAIKILECLEQNIILPGFNFENLKNIYFSESHSAKREILALIINFII